MPKYKVGDIAALFPKPKEPTTEAGKKLQSLFKEFHTRENKSQGASHQNAGSQTVTLKSERTEIENERLPKKRKFTDIETSQSEQNMKKFKKEEPESVKNSMLSKKKNKFPAEQGFPRNKKLSNTGKNKFVKSFNELDKEEMEHENDFNSSPLFTEKNTKKLKKTKGLDDVEDSVLSNEVNKFLSEQGFSKSKKKFKFGEDIHDSEEEKNVHSDVKQQSSKTLKSKNKKQKAIFIKKSKQTELVTSNHSIEGKDNKNLSKGGSVFKNEIKDLNKKSPKDINKNNEHGRKQSSQSPNVSLNHVSENEEKCDEVNGEESFKDDNSLSKNVTDFVRNKKFKKKVISSNNNFVQKSEQEEYGKELDFIKIPDMKPEVSGDELSRTLFVGNLPLDTKRKALRKLFSPFGEIEKIRFHGNETDKAKIFSENGSKSRLNGKNYAADSIPGYIVFKNKESAIFALSLSGTLFKDHHITVDFASPAGSHKLYDDKRSIFIGNLPFDCKDDSIWEVFSECGRIESVRIVRDKETGIGKGFGFVQFSTVQAKENALCLKDLEIQGRPVRVKEVSANKAAQNKTKDVPVVKRSNTFKSHAIRLKKKSKDSTSRKSVTKIMKKQKKLHEKKKISSILQKSMKK